MMKSAIMLLIMDDLAYIEYQNKKMLEHENLCNRCGSCCGIKDNDPCEHLRLDTDGKYICDTYDDRFGLKKTVNGNEMTCVPLRNIFHKTWWGRSECGYIKYGGLS
jgi:uncharacterized cysteine cluster protein YcgN (CxxCxxCC family)